MLALRPALNDAYRDISKQENAHSEATFLMAGGFKCWETGIGFISCAARGDKTLDHLYSTLRKTYKALPPFGILDHNANLLIPSYKAKTQNRKYQ